VFPPLVDHISNLYFGVSKYVRPIDSSLRFCLIEVPLMEQLWALQSLHLTFGGHLSKLESPMDAVMNAVGIEQKSYEMPRREGISIARFLTVADIRKRCSRTSIVCQLCAECVPAVRATGTEPSTYCRSARVPQIPAHLAIQCADCVLLPGLNRHVVPGSWFSLWRISA